MAGMSYSFVMTVRVRRFVFSLDDYLVADALYPLSSYSFRT